MHAITLKAEPQGRQRHETRLRTADAEVKPHEVEKTWRGYEPGNGIPGIKLSAPPERRRGRNSQRVFRTMIFRASDGFFPDAFDR